MPGNAVLLFIDATILRWFPPLRFAWGFRGEPVVVPITGRNAKRVLFGAMNPRTGLPAGLPTIPATPRRWSRWA